jgi:hypothetical protein
MKMQRAPFFTQGSRDGWPGGRVGLTEIPVQIHIRFVFLLRTRFKVKDHRNRRHGCRVVSTHEIYMVDVGHLPFVWAITNGKAFRVTYKERKGDT